MAGLAECKESTAAQDEVKGAGLDSWAVIEFKGNSNKRDLSRGGDIN